MHRNLNRIRSFFKGDFNFAASFESICDEIKNENDSLFFFFRSVTIHYQSGASKLESPVKNKGIILTFQLIVSDSGQKLPFHS